MDLVSLHVIHANTMHEGRSIVGASCHQVSQRRPAQWLFPWAVLFCLWLPACDKKVETESGAFRARLEKSGRNEGVSAGDVLSPAGPLPLPPEDVPLARTIDELEARAAEGDARASCRLAAEYEYCDTVRQQLGSMEETLASSRAQAYSAGEAGIVGLHADVILEKARHCENVVIPPPEQRIRYWRRAAISGHLPSLVAYSLGWVFKPRHTLDTLDALEIYKAEALPLAMRAAEAGSIDAILALAFAYSPDEHNTFGLDTLLAQAVQPDAQEALTLYYYLDNALGENPSEGAKPMREEIKRKIERLSKGLPSRQCRQR